MVELDELYLAAENAGITVDYFMMSYAESLSVPIGNGAIAIDPFKLTTIADEKVKLAHEMGHCETGSFYNQYSPFDIVAQHEVRADKRAITRLIPKDELGAAVADGRTELWELAEFFGVTEPFMQKAINWYKYGTLAV